MGWLGPHRGAGGCQRKAGRGGRDESQGVSRKLRKNAACCDRKSPTVLEFAHLRLALKVSGHKGVSRDLHLPWDARGKFLRKHMSHCDDETGWKIPERGPDLRYHRGLSPAAKDLGVAWTAAGRPQRRLPAE